MKMERTFDEIIKSLDESSLNRKDTMSLDIIELTNKPYSKNFMGKVKNTSVEEKVRKRIDFMDSILVQHIVKENINHDIKKVSKDELSFIYAYKKDTLDDSVRLEKILSDYFFYRNINSVVETPTVEKINGYMEKYVKFGFIEKNDFYNKFSTELNRRYE
jgi:hypothetical protein